MRFNIIRNDYEDSIKLADKLKAIGDQKQDWTMDEKNPEIVFIIGGDGTFLKAVSQYNAILQTVKFLPIKFGGIGFYTNMNRQHEIPNLEDLFNHSQYEAVEFPLLEAKLNDQSFYAINEIKLVNNLKPIDLEIFVDDNLLEKFKGSGLAFSTGSGSTGYTRSVGGAIIYPNIDLYQMVELAPVSTAIFRTINSPIVFSHEQQLNLKTLFPEIKPAILVVDTVQQADHVEQLTIKIADFKLQLISLNNASKEVNKTKFLQEIFVSK